MVGRIRNLVAVFLISKTFLLRLAPAVAIIINMFNFLKIKNRDYSRSDINFGRFIFTDNGRIEPQILVLHGAQSGGKTYLGTEIITDLIEKGVPKVYTFGFNYYYKGEKRDTRWNRILHFFGYIPYLNNNDTDVVERLDVETDETKGMSPDEIEKFCMKKVANVGNCAVVFDEPAGMVPEKRLAYQDKLQQLLKRGVTVVIIVPYPTCIHKRIRVSVTKFVECSNFSLFTQVLWFKRIYRQISQKGFEEELDQEDIKVRRKIFNPFIGRRYDTTELVKSSKKDIHYFEPHNFVKSYDHIHFFYKGKTILRMMYLVYVAFLWLIKFCLIGFWIYMGFLYIVQHRYKGPDCEYKDRGNGFYIRVCDETEKSKKHAFWLEYGEDFTTRDFIVGRFK